MREHQPEECRQAAAFLDVVRLECHGIGHGAPPRIGCAIPIGCSERNGIAPIYALAHGAQAAVDAVGRARPSAHRSRASRAPSGARATTTSCGAGRSTTSRASGRAIWEFFDVQASTPYERVLGAREMPGAQWFPGARLYYAEHFFRDRDDDAVAIRHACELRELVAVDVGRAARADRAHRRRAAARSAWARATASRPTCRTSPRPSRRSWPRASLGAVWSSARAGVRRALGGRPLRADRAQGPAGGRRLPLRRARLRPPRGRRGHRRARSARERRALRLPGRQRLADGARRPRRAAGLRAAPVRPPAVGALSARARRACPSRSSTARAGSCSST